jgi:single-stranded DNA-binding protein
VAQFVRKGARIHVAGRLSESRWTATETREERRALYLNADELFLSLSRIAEVGYKPARDAADTAR